MTRRVVVDGLRLPDVLWRQGPRAEVLIPIVPVARALGVTVSWTGDAAHLTVGGRDIACSVRGLDGQPYVARGDVKRILKVTVFLDPTSQWIAITSSAGLHRLAATARAPGPASKGASPQRSAATPATGGLEVFSVSFSRDGSPAGNAVVTAKVQNPTGRAMHGVTVSLVLVDESGATTYRDVRDTNHSDTRAGIRTYATYTAEVGTLQAGAVREFTIQTGVAPREIDTLSKTMTLELAGYQMEQVRSVKVTYRLDVRASER